MAFDLKNKLAIALEKRAPLFDVTDALRIVNGAADGFPGLTIDKFGDRYQMQFFGPELLTSKTEIVEALAALFNPICVVTKERLSSSGKSLENAPMDVVVGSREDAVGTVREGNANFHVDLLDTINPGLFLDMRHVRLEVEDRFRTMSGASPAHLADLANLENSAQTGLRFLNLFSYTCSFSVHARLGGAAVATNADISGKILDKGRENYAWAQKKGLRFDGIVLDPPSFARFKGFNFNVREHLMPLVADCATLLNPGGFFMVSSNYSEFNLSAFARDVLAAVSSVHPNAKTSWKKSQDVDFVGSGSTKDSCLVATLVEV